MTTLTERSGPPPSAPPGASRRSRGQARSYSLVPTQTTPLLRTFLVLLFGLPSGLVFGPLGAAGSPANILSMLIFLWWFIARLAPQLGVDRGRQPMRVAIYALMVGVGLSYVAGMLRPIAADEVSGADRAILSLIAWSGVALVAVDGIRTRAALDRVLRFLVGCGVFLGGLGMVQFFSGWNPVGAITIPGLTVHTAYGLLAERSDFPRVSGTASHPIEFGVVLSLILPLAMHYAWIAAPDRRRWRWIGVLIIGGALPMTIARSAIVGAAIIMIVAVFTLPRERRRKLLIALPFFIVIMRLLVPGLLGTIKSLFTHIRNDPSTLGRTADYAAVRHFVAENPLFGRGPGTWIPQTYRTLDNAYLGWVIEVGLVGLVLLFALIITGVALALGARRASSDEETRSLGAALAAALISALITFGTFDALGFAMCAGIMFLLLGCTGALWRVTVRGTGPRLPAQSGRPDNRVRAKRIGRTVVAALLIALPTIALLPRDVGTYQSGGALIMQAPKASTSNPYTYSPGFDIPSVVLQRHMTSDQTRAKLAAKGATGDYTVASGDASLAAYTESFGNSALIRVLAVSPDEKTALRTRDALLTELAFELQTMQQQAGAPQAQWILGTVVAQPTSAGWLPGAKKRAYLGVFILLLFATRVLSRNDKVRDGFRTKVVAPLTGSIPVIQRPRRT